MKRWLGWVLLFACGVSFAQGLNKWVDEKGRVHYGDRPPADAKEQAMEKGAVSSVGGQGKSATRRAAATAGSKDSVAGIPPGSADDGMKAFQRELQRHDELAETIKKLDKEQAVKRRAQEQEYKKGLEELKERQLRQAAHQERQACMRRTGKPRC